MPSILYEERALHYVQRGDGAPVLLVHGLGATSAQWALQFAALQSHRKVIIPDLPGCGRSASPKTMAGYGIPGLAAALWTLLDTLKCPAADLVGFSLGGAVTLEMALQRSARVPRLVLINSLPHYGLDDWRKWRLRLEAAILLRLLGRQRVARRTARELFPAPWQRTLREEASAIMSSVPAATYSRMAQALQKWTAIDRLHVVAGRTLVIAGDQDFLSLREKQSMAAALNGDFMVVRGSRHGTPLDSAKATNAALCAWLSDQPLPAAEQWVCDAPTAIHEWPHQGVALSDLS